MRALSDLGDTARAQPAIEKLRSVYCWPRAGGVKFDFQFRPRVGIAAKTAPSQVYDYYNPEARAVVPTVKFRIK